MPPDLESIAGGAKWFVREPVLLAPSVTATHCVSSSPVSSVDTDTSAASDSDSDSDLFSDASSIVSDVAPPSPPIRAYGLGSSPASSTDTLDYFVNDKTFLQTVFGVSHVPEQVIKVESTCPVWKKLAIVEQGPDAARIMYARGSGFKDINMRENLMDLLDKADEEYGCDKVVVVLDKSDPALATTLHSLMYVGGVVIPPQASKHKKDYILVGIDL